jgi:glycerol-1-phosphate dehydrogenase [NAD(P)+]
VSTDRIQAALEGATDTREVLLGAGVLGEVGAVFERAFGDRAAVVIADETTFEVAGKRAGQLLADGGRALAEPYVFPATPTLHADYDNVIPLARFLRATDAIPVAVGSGTLNDLVKRASHEVERPYLTVATAASVDGYTSFGRRSPRTASSRR